MFLAPAASSIPLAALAAILFVGAWNMSEVKRFASVMRKAPIADRIILMITFLLTVFADLVVAVNVGVILAVLQFLRRMAETVETQPVAARTLKAELAELGIAQLPSEIMVYEVVGPMFFGAVGKLQTPVARSAPRSESTHHPARARAFHATPRARCDGWPTVRTTRIEPQSTGVFRPQRESDFVAGNHDLIASRRFCAVKRGVRVGYEAECVTALVPA
jgi:hypothetical protein